MEIAAPNTSIGTQSLVSGTSSNALASDFETFLKLLTTQIQNQDPLSPADSTEFVAQLATFSSVEQQVKTNDQLQTLTTLSGVQSLGQLASWVGMEVRASAPVSFEGDPVTLYPDIPLTAERADLVVRDSSGAEVSRHALPIGADPYEWDGKTTSGSTLANGVYSFSVEPFVGETAGAPYPVTSYHRVREAQMEGGRPVLVLPGGGRLPAELVLSLREADAG